MQMQNCPKCDGSVEVGPSGRCLNCGTAVVAAKANEIPCKFCPQGKVPAGANFCRVCELAQDSAEGISIKTLMELEHAKVDVEKVRLCCQTYGTQTWNHVEMSWEKVARLILIVQRRMKNGKKNVYLRCLQDATTVIGRLATDDMKNATRNWLRNLYRCYTQSVSDSVRAERAAVRDCLKKCGLEAANYSSVGLKTLKSNALKDLSADELTNILKPFLKGEWSTRLAGVRLGAS